jgi:metal-sulfur cluster biosynthetic enzyme
MLTKEDVIEVLKTVEDPELYLDIWLLGLIYGVEVQDDKVSVEMTFTSPMCPAGPMMVDQIKSRLAEKGAREVTVKIVFNPPWEPSDEVKAMLGLI